MRKSYKNNNNKVFNNLDELSRHLENNVKSADEKEDYVFNIDNLLDKKIEETEEAKELDPRLRVSLEENEVKERLYYGLSKVKKLKAIEYKISQLENNEGNDYQIAKLSTLLENLKMKLRINDKTINSREEFEIKLKKSYSYYEEKRIEKKMLKYQLDRIEILKQSQVGKELEENHKRLSRYCKCCGLKRTKEDRCVNINDYRNKTVKYRESKEIIGDNKLFLIGKLEGEEIIFCDEECYESYILKRLGILNYIKFKSKHMDKTRYKKISLRVLKYGMTRKVFDWNVKSKVRGHHLEIKVNGSNIILVISPVGLFYVKKHLNNELEYVIIHSCDYESSRVKEKINEKIKILMREGLSVYGNDNYSKNYFKKCMENYISYYINYIMNLRRKEETLDLTLKKLQDDFNEMTKRKELFN